MRVRTLNLARVCAGPRSWGRLTYLGTNTGAGTLRRGARAELAPWVGKPGLRLWYCKFLSKAL